MSGNNLEFIKYYCRTVFTKKSVLDSSLYLSIMGRKFFRFEKESGKRARGNDRKGILHDLKIMISVVLSELRYSQRLSKNPKLTILMFVTY